MTEKGHIRLEGLRKEFGDLVAVDGVDLEIHGGEFFTLLGPSGCGKTTTLRCIAGLETPTEGDVYLNGERVTDLPANKRNTSIIFQEWALFPHMSVGKNVSFGLEMQGVSKAERRDRVSEVLELVEMPGYEDRRPTELSGGQKQRVAMARSIVQEPDVLLLDEPLASLDRALRERLQVELKNIQQDLGITFLHVTHDQEEALTMSDRIGVMNDGQLEQVGAATDLYEHPDSKFVAEFLGETNLFEGRAARDNGVLTLSDDDLTINIDLEAMADQIDAPLGDGDTVAFTVRPESMLVSNDELDCDNQWTGRIENAIYKGSNSLYEVDVGERILKVQRQRQQGAGLLTEGQEVKIGFDSTEGELIPDTT